MGAAATASRLSVLSQRKKNDFHQSVTRTGMKQLKTYFLLFSLVTLSAFQSFSQGKLSKVQTISYSDTLKDYGPLLQRTIEKIMASGGGTLLIKYGEYPLLTPIMVKNEGNSPKIIITGVKSKSGKLPVFIDADSKKSPHHFFHFSGNINNPSMSVTISNIAIIGNNIPYSSTHPFFGKENAIYSLAVAGINVKSFKVTNVNVKNFYGRGIYIANFHDRKFNRRYRVESPVVRNCQIINVWGYSKRDDSGDGVEFISANNPIVENNTILNDLAQTKYVGRCGIVLEHNVEKAIIRNNTIGGYQRNIHAECDWGGHLIEGNSFSQSSIAITLSEDCGQPESLKSEFSPNIIRNNKMYYKQEYKKFSIPKSTYSFISIHKPSFMLEGLQIVNNKMFYTIDSKLDQSRTAKNILEKNKNIYIDLKNQSKAVVKGNQFN
jgi:hypothetical protein